VCENGAFCCLFSNKDVVFRLIFSVLRQAVCLVNENPLMARGFTMHGALRRQTAPAVGGAHDHMPTMICSDFFKAEPHAKK